LEFLKEFFHFVLTGRARKFLQEVTVDKAEAEASHLEFVRNLDEIIDKEPIPVAPPPPPFIAYEPKLDEPQHKPVYKLNEGQLERLKVSVKIGDVAWSIPQPRPGDDQEVTDGLNKLNQDIADLQGLGLIRDVSEHFTEKIAKAMKLYGRHVRYYAPTAHTFAMFTNKEYYRDEEGDKVRERIVQ